MELTINELKNLTSLALLKKAFELYEIQTKEFITTGKVSIETLANIYIFDFFCVDNDYLPLIVIPIKN